MNFGKCVEAKTTGRRRRKREGTFSYKTKIRNDRQSSSISACGSLSLLTFFFLYKLRFEVNSIFYEAFSVHLKFNESHS